MVWTDSPAATAAATAAATVMMPNHQGASKQAIATTKAGGPNASLLSPVGSVATTSSHLYNSLSQLQHRRPIDSGEEARNIIVTSAPSSSATIPVNSHGNNGNTVRGPFSADQAIRMSSAVDGLLSLRAAASRDLHLPPAEVQNREHPHVRGGSGSSTPSGGPHLPPLPPPPFLPGPPHTHHQALQGPKRSSPSCSSSSPTTPSPSSSAMLHGQQSQQQSHSEHNMHSTPHRRSPINMERLWAGDRSQLPPQAQSSTDSRQGQAGTNGGPGQHPPGNGPHAVNEGGGGGITEMPPEEEEEPLICMICEDKATGLHYGIITCEG